MGDPAPSQRKAKNAAAKFQLPEGHDEPSVSQNLPKSKRKKVANTQSDPESDKGEGTSNTPEYVLYFCGMGLLKGFPF
jgi:hypothetical protein